MPTISVFFGIVIQMFWKDHGPPHFHALYAEHEALIDIRTLQMLQGSLPKKGACHGFGVGRGSSAGIDGELGKMQANGDAGEDRAAEVMPRPQPALPWRVAEVQALPGHRLGVRFNDGTSGEVDMAKFLSSDRAGVFAALRDETVFGRVGVVLGAVTWPGDLDLAPDAMYRQIKENGTWVVD